MSETEFISYEEALELKKLEFGEECFGSHYKRNDGEIFLLYGKELEELKLSGDEDMLCECSAPTYHQAFRWFRKNHNLLEAINLHDREDEKSWRFEISVIGKYEMAYIHRSNSSTYFKNYEEAELACLKKLIEIVKKKTNEKSI